MFVERLPEFEFTGIIYLCNAQPPLMDFISAKANITEIDEERFGIRLYSDSVFIDTVLIYKHTCKILEETNPNIILFDLNDEEAGIIRSGRYFLEFFFPYNECTNNTFFEGIVIE